jgi:hypothetical protein
MGDIFADLPPVQCGQAEIRDIAGEKVRRERRWSAARETGAGEQLRLSRGLQREIA